MGNIEQLNIDKYLEWLKPLTAEIFAYQSQKKRLARVEIAVDYLLKRWAGKGVLGGALYGLNLKKDAETSRLLWQHFTKEKEHLSKSIEAFHLDSRPGLSLIYFEANNIYTPSLNDWVWLEVCRKEFINSFRSVFEEMLSSRNVKSQTERIKEEFEGIMTVIQGNLFYKNVLTGHPIVKDHEKHVQGGGLWANFIDWVCYVDCANWLYSKLTNECTQSIEAKQTDKKPSRFAVALCYYYLWKANKHEGLREPNALTPIAKKFKISEDTLRKAYNIYFKDEGQITKIDSWHTNEVFEKPKRIEDAIELLKNEPGGKEASKLALTDLKTLKEKINQKA